MLKILGITLPLLLSVKVFSAPEASCTDLYQSACLDSSSMKNKRPNAVPRLEKSAADTVREAQDKGAKAAGFKSLDDAIQKKLASEKVNASAIRQDCDNKINEAESYLDEPSKKADELKRQIAKVEASSKSISEKNLFYISKDIPVFFQKEFNDKCPKIKNNPNTYPRENNERIYELCEKSGEIRAQALKVYRAEGTKQYSDLAAKFVADYDLPKLVVKGKPNKNSAEIQQLHRKLEAANARLSKGCTYLTESVNNHARNLSDGVRLEINLSKPTIDHLTNKFYSEDRRDVVEKNFKDIRASAQSMVAQIVSDPEKRAKIVQSYDKLNLHWQEKVDDSKYRKGPMGIPILDEAKFVARGTDLFDDLRARHADPNLSFYTNLNANYMSELQFGEVKQDARVNMMPMFLEQLGTDLPTFNAIMAHELGHNIGPLVSRQNGFDMTPEYKDLLACYADNKSIKATRAQSDEIIADYVASQFVAQKMSAMPLEDREKYLKDSVKAFCLFDDGEEKNHYLGCRGVHAQPALRIGGIFGANPKIRELLGCSGESTEYKTCGMTGLQLTQPASPDSATQKNRTEKGRN